MAMVTYTEKQMKKLKSKTDWERVRNMKEEDIDYSDIPIPDDEMIANAVRYSYGKPVSKDNKVCVDLKIDNDIFTFFKSMGEDWENKLNDALLHLVKIMKMS